ncbi:hypothetical protein [Paracoccus sp. PAR01]|uniref:hypothetical protein n=1 Tax=Paracoccus sp. PAR01 TaxID=2769282 RepID=UPI001780B68D|nr:hypothetical protein [Paracoccus sp. PAR01]MBD9526208.1 hypothetical protein [Paracoccus sp. PAR01]
MLPLSADLFDDHADDQVSVTPLGRSADALWIGHEQFPNLLEAIKWIVAQNGKDQPYLVMVHAPDGDTTISSEVLADLVTHVRSFLPQEG